MKSGLELLLTSGKVGSCGRVGGTIWRGSTDEVRSMWQGTGTRGGHVARRQALGGREGVGGKRRQMTGEPASGAGTKEGECWWGTGNGKWKEMAGTRWGKWHKEQESGSRHWRGRGGGGWGTRGSSRLPYPATSFSSTCSLAATCFVTMVVGHKFKITSQ